MTVHTGTTTAPINIVLEYGWPQQDTCALCSSTTGAAGYVGVAAAGLGRVCEDCANNHAPTRGVFDLATALDSLDTALHFADEEHRPSMVAAALEGVQRLAWKYRAGGDAR